MYSHNYKFLDDAKQHNLAKLTDNSYTSFPTDNSLQLHSYNQQLKRLYQLIHYNRKLSCMAAVDWMHGHVKLGSKPTNDWVGCSLTVPTDITLTSSYKVIVIALASHSCCIQPLWLTLDTPLIVQYSSTSTVLSPLSSIPWYTLTSDIAGSCENEWKYSDWGVKRS